MLTISRVSAYLSHGPALRSNPTFVPSAAAPLSALATYENNPCQATRAAFLASFHTAK